MAGQLALGHRHLADRGAAAAELLGDGEGQVAAVGAAGRRPRRRRCRHGRGARRARRPGGRARRPRRPARCSRLGRSVARSMVLMGGSRERGRTDPSSAGSVPCARMRRDYGQYCPVALGSEVLADRWTPLILREMVLGSTRFNDIERGLPGISRTPAGPAAAPPRAQGRPRTASGPARAAAASTTSPTAGQGPRAASSWPLGEWAVRWMLAEPEPSEVDPGHPHLVDAPPGRRRTASPTVGWSSSSPTRAPTDPDLARARPRRAVGLHQAPGLRQRPRRARPTRSRWPGSSTGSPRWPQRGRRRDGGVARTPGAGPGLRSLVPVEPVPARRPGRAGPEVALRHVGR